MEQVIESPVIAAIPAVNTRSGMSVNDLETLRRHTKAMLAWIERELEYKTNKKYSV